MKGITGGPEAAAWNGKLVDQLGFIKKKLRYPVGRYMLLPFALLFFLLPVVAFDGYRLLEKTNNKEQPPVGLVIIIAVFLLLLAVAGRRFWKNLHFSVIATPFFQTENMTALSAFLMAHNFAFSRHPDAPEVFQMMSRPVGGYDGQREILIFIADDRRILINSHFTQSRFNYTAGRSHDHQIAAMLQSWIDSGAVSGQEIMATRY